MCYVMIKHEFYIWECIVAAVLLFTLPLLVFGESPGIGNKVFSFGPRAVYSTPQDADSGQWSVGVQGRLHLSLGLALEGSIDTRSNHFSNFTTIKTWPVQVSLLAYLFPGAFVSPYLLGGAGWYYTQSTGPFSFSQTSNRFGLHAGAGLEIILNKSLSLDCDYRYLWMESDSFEDNTYQDSGSMTTIALNYLF